MPAPWDWATHQPFGLDENVAIIADPYVEESHEEITSDISQDSSLPEQLPEASYELEITRPVPPRTIQTRTQTDLEREIPGRTGQRFSHFGYPFDSESKQEVTEPPILDPSPQVVFPELDDLEPLFSDQEELQPETPTRCLIPSPSGTSAPLLSNPYLTDTLSNFPLFGTQARSFQRSQKRGWDPKSESKPISCTTQQSKQEGTTTRQTPWSRKTAHYFLKQNHDIFQRTNHLAQKKPKN